jgi:mannose-1-phosphate guanylyltransferase
LVVCAFSFSFFFYAWVKSTTRATAKFVVIWDEMLRKPRGLVVSFQAGIVSCANWRDRETTPCAMPRRVVATTTKNSGNKVCHQTALALATAELYKRDPKVIVGSFAADHVIRNNGKLLKAIEASVEIAATGKIVTIGIVPTEASVAFGYMKKGSPILGTEGFEVADFIEKPNIKKAGKFVASKKYLWNAGMFIAPAKLLLDVLAKTQPKLHAGVMELAEHWDTENRAEKLHSIWPGLDKIAIDYAIAEPAAKLGLVAVVPGNFEWHDVGDFAAIAELQSQGNSNNLAVLGSAKVLSDSSSGILVSDTNRLVALIGLEDIIVVDTADALLITSKAHAQKVKAMVEALKQTGHSDLL